MVEDSCLLVTVRDFFKGAGSTVVYPPIPRVVEGWGLSGRGNYPFFLEDKRIVPHRYHIFFGGERNIRMCVLIMLFHLFFPSVVVTLDLSFVSVATSHAPYKIVTGYREDVSIHVRETKNRK